MDSTEPDRTLETSRSCIEKVGTLPFFAPVRARSHFAIANILNDRGIYEEALRHAKEATDIDPGDAFAWQERAKSLTRLGQAKEAIAAAKEAIRLSDGKYGYMHFTLGAALFDAHDFRAARQSFEKAAELDQKDAAAPYNVALCLERLGFSRDATSWYEEVLRRDPNDKRRSDILKRIQELRR